MLKRRCRLRMRVPPSNGPISGPSPNAPNEVVVPAAPTSVVAACIPATKLRGLLWVRLGPRDHVHCESAFPQRAELFSSTLQVAEGPTAEVACLDVAEPSHATSF